MKAFISLGLLVLVSLTTVMAVDQSGDQLQTLSNKGTQDCVAVTRRPGIMTTVTEHNCSEAYETKRTHGFRARMLSKEQ